MAGAGQACRFGAGAAGCAGHRRAGPAHPQHRGLRVLAVGPRDPRVQPRMPNAATAAAMAWRTWAELGSSDRCSGEANSASARAELMVGSYVADRIGGLLG